jgi:glycosyltransferase involved in cell wall biosynthesis
MANLSVYMSNAVNGVAEIHSELLKRDLFRHWYARYPERFQNKTNGITPRRWLGLSNPELTRLITDVIGPGFLTDLDRLEELKPHINEELIERFNRVKLLKNRENQGVSLTRNRGVRHARYPFIAFLDSDDAWLPEKLELQLAELENHPEAAICCTATAFLDCRGCRLRHIFQVPDSLTYRDLLPQNAICCSSVLARAEYVRRFPMVPDPDIHEDYALWLAILGVTPRAVGVDRALTIYRVNPAGKSGNKFRSAWMQWRTYLHIGLTRRLAAFYFTQYALRGMKKYLKIYQEGRACEDTDALRPVFGG